MKNRHRAGIKPVHANGEPCLYRKGQACPGREYQAQCKNAGCHFNQQMDARVQLEYVRDTSTCPTNCPSADPGTSRAAQAGGAGGGAGLGDEKPVPALDRPVGPQIRKTGSESRAYRLTCPEQDCGRLGDYSTQRMAPNAFGDHCDAPHPALSPMDLVRSAVERQEDGDGQWTSRALSGHRFSVRRTGEGSFRIDAAGRTVTAVAPLASLARAQLCITQPARIVNGSQAEAARRQILREERTASAAS
ncbi:hypothetical protein ACIBBE_24685 [Streptomyces sp. NPDC051644]|uniref:hypothetical protein n=1 Tax=Streptomyces sp. NPDC051644 TaxID=3365666 RepID=UPI00378CDE01